MNLGSRATKTPFVTPPYKTFREIDNSSRHVHYKPGIVEAPLRDLTYPPIPIRKTATHYYSLPTNRQQRKIQEVIEFWPHFR